MVGDNGGAKLSGAQSSLPKLGQAGTPNMGQAQSPDLGRATSEVKPEIPVDKKPEPPITDFKVAEIWIRSGQIMLDASEAFWTDRCRALGVLEFCKEIVKTAQPPKPPKNKIIQAKGSFLNGIRNLIFGRRK